MMRGESGKKMVEGGNWKEIVAEKEKGKRESRRWKAEIDKR